MDDETINVREDNIIQYLVTNSVRSKAKIDALTDVFLAFVSVLLPAEKDNIKSMLEQRFLDHVREEADQLRLQDEDLTAEMKRDLGL